MEAMILLMAVCAMRHSSAAFEKLMWFATLQKYSSFLISIYPLPRHKGPWDNTFILTVYHKIIYDAISSCSIYDTPRKAWREAAQLADKTHGSIAE